MIKSYLCALLLFMTCMATSIALAQDAETDASASAEQRILVNGFQFFGNSVISSDILSGIVSNSVGKELSLAELEEVAVGVSAYYHSQDYFLAATLLPEQDIVNGIVNRIFLRESLGRWLFKETSVIPPVSYRLILTACAMKACSGEASWNALFC